MERTIGSVSWMSRKWITDLNGTTDPSSIAVGSPEQYWFRCDHCKIPYRTVPIKLLYDQNCPNCVPGADLNMTVATRVYERLAESIVEKMTSSTQKKTDQAFVKYLRIAWNIPKYIGKIQFGDVYFDHYGPHRMMEAYTKSHITMINLCGIYGIPCETDKFPAFMGISVSGKSRKKMCAIRQLLSTEDY